MAYEIAGLTCISSPPYTAVPKIWGYVTEDTVAQVQASGYFNAEPRLGLLDAIRANCLDGTVWLRITAVSPNVTVAVDTNAVSNLADGDIWVGNALNAAVPVTPSGDVSMTNAGVFSVNSVNPELMNYAAVPMSAAEWNGMYAAPFEIVEAPAAGFMHVVDRVVLQFTDGSAQFADGGAAALQYGDTVNGAGPLATATVAAATVNGWTADTAIMLAGALAATALASLEAEGLFMSNITGAFTTGTGGSFVVHVWYKTVSV